MKIFLTFAALAIGLVGCGQSGTGGSADYESGNGSEITPAEAGGALGPTPAQTQEPTPVNPDPALNTPETSSVTPAVPPPGSGMNPPPAETQIPAPDDSAAINLNQQGTQTTPEPATGDDRNPDAVNP